MLLIIGKNPFSIRRTTSSINPGLTFIRRIATYIAYLLSLDGRSGQAVLALLNFCSKFTVRKAKIHL
jgi:hypothetical protein